MPVYRVFTIERYIAEWTVVADSPEEAESWYSDGDFVGDEIIDVIVRNVEVIE
jgi:hypothetical protein